MSDPVDQAILPIVTAFLGALGTALAVWLKTAAGRTKADAEADTAALADYRLVFQDLRSEAGRMREEGERMRTELRTYVDRIARLEGALEAMEQAHARVESERDSLRAEVGKLRAELRQYRHPTGDI